MLYPFERLFFGCSNYVHPNPIQYYSFRQKARMVLIRSDYFQIFEAHDFQKTRFYNLTSGVLDASILMNIHNNLVLGSKSVKV